MAASNLRLFPKINSLVLRHYTNSKVPLLRTSISTNENHKKCNMELTQQCRYLHKSGTRHNNPNYEPDGKTTVTILNDEIGAPLMIDSYTKHGFKLNNGVQVLGPMVIFPKTVLGWDVAGVHDITPTSLALFSILEPKPDVLVIGIGDKGSKIPLETIHFLRKKKINMEILATEHACTTFNFLSGEGRCAVGVMIPPSTILWTAFDIVNTKLRKKQLYEDDDNEEHPDTILTPRRKK